MIAGLTAMFARASSQHHSQGKPSSGRASSATAVASAAEGSIVRRTAAPTVSLTLLHSRSSPARSRITASAASLMVALHSLSTVKSVAFVISTPASSMPIRAGLCSSS
eukprot:3429-Heterococcus_DN1.PRE.1